MAGERTHASFFSGVGGLDLGLERAGWRTVSFSEIDPYASAVLAERWPGVPNLGDIVRLAAGPLGDGDPSGPGAEPLGDEGASDLIDGRRVGQQREPADRVGRWSSPDDQQQLGRDETWRTAWLWTGGFPCQDLSVAGKRRGMVEGSRSNLAHAFLDLVERHRPPAVLLENVPGLLSSHRGRDMAALLGRLAELGYGVAYRVLDARHFGVPQRRRRVFILGLRSEADDPTGRVAAERAAQVLAVGSRCDRHPPTGVEAGPGVAEGAGERPDIVGTVPAGLGHHGNGGHSSQAVAAGHVIATAVRASDGHHGHGSPRGDGGDNLIVGSSPDSGGVREADGLAGRLDGSRNVAPSLRARGNASHRDDTEAYVTVRRATRAHSADDADRWEVADEAGNLNGWDLRHGDGNELAIGTSTVTDDPLLPLGLDSHRYRCCGNGVVASVAEWIGQRLAFA